MTKNEAMQMALDVLTNKRYAPSIKETTEALHAALAQPEPSVEPVVLPDWPERESLADLEYAQTTPEDWTDDYKRCWQQLQVCERNKIILWKHAKALEGAVEYERSEKIKYFKLYDDACETARLRLQEIARLEAGLKSGDLSQ